MKRSPRQETAAVKRALRERGIQASVLHRRTEPVELERMFGNGAAVNRERSDVVHVYLGDLRACVSHDHDSNQDRCLACTALEDLAGEARDVLRLTLPSRPSVDFTDGTIRETAVHMRDPEGRGVDNRGWLLSWLAARGRELNGKREKLVGALEELKDSPPASRAPFAELLEDVEAQAVLVDAALEALAAGQLAPGALRP